MWFPSCEIFGMYGSRLGQSGYASVGDATVSHLRGNVWVVSAGGKSTRVVGFCWQAYAVAVALGGAR